MKFIFLGFFLVYICLLLSLCYPGIKERKLLSVLYKSGAEIDKYIALMGKQNATYYTFDDFKKSRDYDCFKVSRGKEGQQYLIWNKEGLPYYSVLVIVNESKYDVESLMIK